MPQMVGRGADVGAHGVAHQGIQIVPQIRLQQALHGRPHPVDDRTQIPRLALARLLEFFQGRQDRPTLGVPQHHHQSGAVPRRGKLDAADLGGRDDVPGHPDHEQVAETLVEDDLGRHPRVGAPEDDGKRLLSRRQCDAARLTREGVRAPLIGDEPTIALAQALQCLSCCNHRLDTDRCINKKAGLRPAVYVAPDCVVGAAGFEPATPAV